MKVNNGSPFRNIPSVDSVLNAEKIKSLGFIKDQSFITEIIRSYLSNTRELIQKGAPSLEEAEIISDIYDEIIDLLEPKPKKIINAAGVIIHTNLGRAPLSESAQKSIVKVSGGYSDLEYDLLKGTRGSRHIHPERLLQLLSKAESAIVVNNNASALLLSLSTLASGKEVIVSRGESIEIGGRFRIPDVLKQSGAKIIEVGTTNRTYVEDYEDAITEETAAILRVHRSNFEIVGFSHTPEAEDLAILANKYSIPLINDLGSGCLINTAKYGLDPEPTVKEAINEGAHLALFSGDKLLGGPQAGIAVGQKIYIDQLKKHPLARAVRIDKLDLAALTATLIPYLTGNFEEEIPIWRMISADIDSLDKRAKRWSRNLRGIKSKVINGTTAVGGGSLPGQLLPTRNLAIPQESCGVGGTEKIAGLLRNEDTPIIARVSEDNILFDPRTILPEDDDTFLKNLKAVFS
jgi:L-seryl-tRNA(Ser) seleniumtransferase